jgi:hypothetical protein
MGKSQQQLHEGLLFYILREERSYMKKQKITAVEKVTSRDIKYILVYLLGRKLKENEALNFLKEIDGCILEVSDNKSSKAMYSFNKT